MELFQIAQANSEHSRHWVFKGELWVDGVRVPEKHLMDVVRQPLAASGPNSVIAFRDDSSAIRGTEVNVLAASDPLAPSPLVPHRRCCCIPRSPPRPTTSPRAWPPIPVRPPAGAGASATTRRSGGAGWSARRARPTASAISTSPATRCPGRRTASPILPISPPRLEILIEASNGASDYGNCFGEPLIYGFTRTFGLRLPDGYRSWYKPIMYSVGAGQIRDEHTVKGRPEKDMLVVQVGGPAYRIGMGGGAASSMEQGKNVQELDFNAVQRGDPEMEQRVNRLIRACAELGEANPIVSAHDLGAGGDCNALPEIVEPAGAVIDLRAIPVGDQTLSVLEIWGNESQERNALLVLPAQLGIMETLAARENVPLAVVGRVTGDGVLVLYDEPTTAGRSISPWTTSWGNCRPKSYQFERARRAARRAPTSPLGPPPRLGLPPGARPGPAASGHRFQALPHQQGGPRRHRARHPAATGRPAPPAPV